jgi:hypothetical protein
MSFGAKTMSNTFPKMIAYALVFTMLIAAPAMAGSTVTDGGGAPVKDGSLEHGHFVDTQGNYMNLPNDSTTIRNWTVFTSSGDIVWAKSPTEDGYYAADGKYFVDLTGFGSNAQDGAIMQAVHLKKGVTYTVSLDVYANNDTIPLVTVAGQAITLTPGTPFTVNGTEWIPMTGQFVSTATTKAAILEIANTNNASALLLIDDISILPQN